MCDLYADIIIDISHEALDRIFQYQVPSFLREKVCVGARVTVPFGAGTHKRSAYVVGLSNTPSIAVNQIKEICEVQEEQMVVEGHFIKLAAWIKQQYGSTMIDALKVVMPIKEKVNSKEQKHLSLLVEDSKAKELLFQYQQKKYTKKAKLLEALMNTPSLSYEQAVKELDIGKSTIDAMEKQQVIAVKRQEVYRTPIFEADASKTKCTLNEEQQKAVDRFTSDYSKKQYETYLLHGVTGSGKTEVYMEMIEHVLKEGRQAIVLIPEISLTYQTVKRFVSRFGTRVSIMNSKLSNGERYDQFMRAKRGEVDIMIGPRSALFTPFSNLGLIIVDEEHEGSYKSDSMPKYHAREVAIQRGKMVKASVVLGSATPSIESYTNAQLQNYVLLTLKNRAKEAVLPKVYVEDLREELKKGNRTMFSERLRRLISEALEGGQQIMLFMNRRGYSSFVSCRSCGSVIKCPHCDVSLTYHQSGELKCHYCGFSRRTPKTCPDCNSKFIGAFGTGTQKLEEAVKKEFPKARVLRMDFDTTRKKHSYEEILSSFSKGEADVLVGTQMIVKGHDFPKVTVVGIMVADMSLNTNDFRSSERTFQLLTQAAGRAGRGELAGNVVIQTYQPNHYSILAAKAQDYESFYQQELSYRQLLRYPPIYQMMVIFVASSEQEEGMKMAMNLKEKILSLENSKDYCLVGPSVATIGRIKDIYRHVLYVKHLEYEGLTFLKDYLELELEKEKENKKIKVYFDFNPMGMY